MTKREGSALSHVFPPLVVRNDSKYFPGVIQVEINSEPLF